MTPLQMALVAAAVANGGQLMEPTFLQQVTDPDGRTTDELDPEESSRPVMSEETASQVAEMMTNVAEEGTASGLSVGGRHARGQDRNGGDRRRRRGSTRRGSSASRRPRIPQIAVAATIERCQGCFGGETAGPIATDVMESLLGD